MISVDSRDGRKGLALGFDVPRQMEETELEEGEACSFQDDDPTIDPDIALSYIDEKIQDVLGHFQKDFEGGVSAENLGAKFGGYGSFLPTYQRSPVSSHPRSPVRAQICNGPNSPNKMEGVRLSSVAPLSSLQARSETDSASVVKRDVCKPMVRGQEFPLRSNASDQKMLKVRIKVGSDNLSTRKNAEIYSGLGLDISPSSSLDDSPTESEGSRVPHAPDESPSSIIQMMTSFPVHGALLLSPLPDDLLGLTEKRNSLRESRSGPISKSSHDIPNDIGNRHVSVKGDEKALGNKKTKSVGKNGFPVELPNGSKDIDVTCKKETEIDSVACEELVSNTLKLPILANPYCSSGGTDKRANSLNGVSVCQRKEGDRKAEKTFDPIKADSNVSKGKKGLKSEPLDPPKPKISQEVTSHAPDSFKGPTGRRPSSSGGRKKSKESQSHGNPAPDLAKENSRVDSSSLPKYGKSKSEAEGAKIQKGNGKASDRYKEFFGDMKLEEGDNGMGSSQRPSDDWMDSDMVEKRMPVLNNGSKDRFCHKKIDKSSKSEVCSEDTLNAAPLNENNHISAAAPAVVVDEDWVCCDKCQKWRLLPFGIKPSDLPDFWSCSMQHWLPGMNQCSFSEAETNNALLASYQLPALESQNNMHGHGDAVASTVNFADVRNPNQSHQNPSSHSVPSSRKKKHRLKETSNTTNRDGHTQFSNSTKKKLQPSVKSINEPENQHLSGPFVTPSEKHGHEQKEKHKKRDRSSNGGDTRKLKMKSRGEIGEDSSRASKKIKTEGMLDTDGGWMSNRGGPIEKVGPSSSSGLLVEYGERSSSKDVKHDASDNLHAPVRKPKNKAQVSMDDRSIEAVKHDSRDTTNKRKESDDQNNEIYSGSLPGTGHLPHDDRGSVRVEAAESDQGKKKKARLPKIEERDFNASKGSGKTDRKGDRKDQLRGSSKRDLGSLQASVAATSSSSKVSGSHKTKANFHELKGSPVESVSSSPLRFSNPDVSTLTRRNAFGKVDSQDGCTLALGSPRRYSDGENFGRADRSGMTRKDKNANGSHHMPPDSSVHDFRDRDFSHSSGSKAKQKMSLPELANHDASICNGEPLCHDLKNLNEPQPSDHFHNEEVKNENHYRANELHPRNSEFGNGKIKIDDSSNAYEGHAHQDKTREGKYKLQEKIGLKPDKVDKSFVGKKGKLIENSKRENQSKSQGRDGLIDNDERMKDNGEEKYSKRSHSGKAERTAVSGLPPSGGGENGTLTHCLQPVSVSEKGPGPNIMSVDASDADVAEHHRKVANISGMQHTSSRRPMPNGHRGRDMDARSPVGRDSTSQAANSALREAKNLKHMADRHKNSGSNLESTGLYFQAALKFLHGASLLESCNSDGTKHADTIQSMQIYSSTAKLCEFCAHEYERFKDMAAAALAYKCMEVAYMRVIYSSHTTAGRDRHELQLALQMLPPGESPSSSASDVDNLNNPPTADKVALTKGASSPQVVGNHVIAARNRPSFLRLLTYTQDVNFAMEASRKSRLAFAAANVTVESAQYKEGLSSLKIALDFNFQDVEGLLQLVRLAMEAFSRD